MRDQLSHRGPDGRANWTRQYERGSVALGFRRLKVISPGPASDQPMISRCGSKILVFNGEIYNYQDLRQQLKQLGHRFRTESDTEVLLVSYEQWGEKCVERLNGMFAFIIWDETRQRAFVARDRFGEKPLFWSMLRSGGLVFSSEAKGLLAHPEIKGSFNWDLLNRVLVESFVEQGSLETCFSDVYQFPPAHCLTVEVDGIPGRLKRYWAPNYSAHEGPDLIDQHIEAIEELLVRSLRQRLRSDAPVTASLSGGLDSSTLVSLISDLNLLGSERVLETFSARFPNDKEVDEGPFIDQVLHKYGLKGHSITPSVDDLSRDFGLLHWHHESVIPGPSMYLEWSVMRAVREAGFKVVIDGQGADEVFAGYTTYFQSLQVELAQRGPRGLWSALRIGATRDQRLNREETANWRPGTARKRESLGLLSMAKCRIKWIPDRYKMYGTGDLPDPRQIGPLRFDLALNLLKTSLPRNLFSGDRNSMAHGVECRFPFLDYELVDFATKLGNSAYLHDGWSKFLLRRLSEKRLPDRVVWRPEKVGFEAPTTRWLGSPSFISLVSERVLDPVLESIPGYSRPEMERLLAPSGRRAGTLPERLWKWASAAELISLGPAFTNGHRQLAIK